MYRLQIYDQLGGLESNIVLSPQAVTIGREPTCEVPLAADINVSRRHARIEPLGRFYIIRDLKSTNGTWVNQNPVRMHLLKHGDVIRIGGYRFLVQVTGEPASPGGSMDLDLDECNTKLIEDPFAYDTSPESRHTLRIDVGKESLQIAGDQKLRERLLRLHDISRKLGFIETPTVLCGQALEIILAELKADRASLLVPESSGIEGEGIAQGGEELVTVATRVASTEKGKPFNIHSGVVRSSIGEMSAILTEDAAQDRRFQDESSSSVRSVMCVPLVAQTNLQGVIYVDRTTNPQPFTEDDLRFLAVIGNQVAINLANARLFEEVLIEKQKVQAVISSLKDGLVITDPDLVVQSCNAAAEQILFRENDGFPVGKNLLELLQSEDYSMEESELLSVIQEGKEFRLLVQHGQELRAYAAAVAAISPEESNKAGYAFSFRDTTDLLHLQELKSEFIRNASHKLRTPLTVVLGSLDLLRTLPPEELAENRTLLISGMEKHLDQLQGLVSRFLEFAELDRARFKLRETELKDVVAVAVNGALPAFSEKKIRIQNEIPRKDSLPVLGDADRLVQCLQNILDNAAKFAPERSTVRVCSDCGEEWIRLHIEDEGPGIPAEDLLDIFSGFHQVEKVPTGEVPGAGLGLTIAKHIIHAHHGSITAQSPVPHTGKGTAITISLPRPGVHEHKELALPQEQKVF